MNPIRKHLETKRTGVRKSEYETFSINEAIRGTSAIGVTYEEYQVDARFGLKHIIRNDIDPAERDRILGYIREDAIRKINTELYGEIREGLYELRTKLYKRNLQGLAHDVSKLIEETL